MIFVVVVGPKVKAALLIQTNTLKFGMQECENKRGKTSTRLSNDDRSGKTE
jgi:hypothetical protein